MGLQKKEVIDSRNSTKRLAADTQFSKATRKKPQYFFYTPIMNSLRKKLEIAGRMGVTGRKKK